MLQFIMSMLLFFLIFLALNYAVLYGVSIVFNLPRTNTLYIIILIAALSYPISATLERIFSNLPSRIFYYISAAWFGISIYIVISLAVYVIFIPSINLFIKIPTLIIGEILIIIAVLVSIYALINATRLEVKEITVHLNGLKNNIRAVQLSDVHIGPIRNVGFIKRIVDETNELKPDIILITGDLFDGTSKLHKEIPNALNKFKAPILFVTGNHDTYQDLNEISKILAKTRVKTLNKELFHFKDLQIIGIDYSLEKRHIEKALQNIEYDRNKPLILLNHLPREFKTAQKAGIQLQLSGHTHNGQFFPINYIVKMIFPYIKGLYEYQGAKLYVSQGTGTWGPPMRLGSRCEITLIKIKK
ncbi:MAG: metallophosphoesterase [Methanobacterium sp.]